MQKKFLLPKFEAELITSNDYQYIVGIDEVGRGSWAGPVAVGAYIYSLKCLYKKGINDSKLLTSTHREDRYKILCKDNYKVKFGEIEEINQLGIGKTITRLITEIINEINQEFQNPYFIIDGQFAKNFGKNTSKKIKADSTYYCVAAASILAKVERDRLMKELHIVYPRYGFNTNMGYPTKQHMVSLNQYGPCDIHRKSFQPIKYFYERMSLEV